MNDSYEEFLNAIVKNDVRAVTRLIESGIDLNYRCDQGASVLFGAVLIGNPIVIRLLLEHGADPNLVADEPASHFYAEKPLELARQARFVMDWDKFQPIVKMLVEFGATNTEGETGDDSPAVELRAREWQAREKSLI